MIKTPDQKLRVFISSTLHELVEERAVAKQAVEHLHLIPVLFEISARPHPPRELYRDYLFQSDIFIGIYWNRYGWVAPDMTISGLEDEYRLSDTKPKLIYIKQSEDREEKLKQLLLDIQSSDSVSYKPFKNSDELIHLIENDLALLLTERFHSPANESELDPVRINLLPQNLDVLIGRENDLKQCLSILENSNNRLITICGSGGIGKTRFSIELAKSIENKFKDGVAFISLAAIRDPDLVPSAIAATLNLKAGGQLPIEESLILWCLDKSILFLLDNLEQVTEAGLFISKLLNRAPAIKIIITSRTPIYIRLEKLYELEPLSLPSSELEKDILNSSAIQFFLHKIQTINPRFKQNSENIIALKKLCVKLDGIPLAIELAALRLRHSPPGLLVSGIDSTLDLVSKGLQDVPERQQTMRATIKWSYDLLSTDEQKLFRLLSIFSGGWYVDQAIYLAVQIGYGSDENTESLLERLVDLGLILSARSNIGRRYSMFKIIKEYGMELLQIHNELVPVSKWHAEYHSTKALKSDPYFTNSVDLEFATLVSEDIENYRTAFEYYVNNKLYSEASKFIGPLEAYYWLSCNKIYEGLQWIEKLNIDIDYLKNLADSETKLLLTRAYQCTGSLLFFTGRYDECLKINEEALYIFNDIQDFRGSALCTFYLGNAGINIDHPESEYWLLQCIDLSLKAKLNFTMIMSKTLLAEIMHKKMEYHEAIKLLDEAELIAEKTSSQQYKGPIYSIRGNLVLAQGKIDEAFNFFKESLQWFERSSFITANVWALIGMAICYFEKENNDKSRHFFKEAINNARLTGEKLILYIAGIGLACILYREGKTKEAIRLFAASINLKSKLNSKPWKSIDMSIEKWIQPLYTASANPEFASEILTGKKLNDVDFLNLIIEN